MRRHPPGRSIVLNFHRQRHQRAAQRSEGDAGRMLSGGGPQRFTQGLRAGGVSVSRLGRNLSQGPPPRREIPGGHLYFPRGRGGGGQSNGRVPTAVGLPCWMTRLAMPASSRRVPPGPPPRNPVQRGSCAPPPCPPPPGRGRSRSLLGKQFRNAALGLFGPLSFSIGAGAFGIELFAERRHQELDCLANCLEHAMCVDRRTHVHLLMAVRLCDEQCCVVRHTGLHNDIGGHQYPRTITDPVRRTAWPAAAHCVHACGICCAAEDNPQLAIAEPAFLVGIRHEDRTKSRTPGARSAHGAGSAGETARSSPHRGLDAISSSGSVLCAIARKSRPKLPENATGARRRQPHTRAGATAPDIPAARGAMADHSGRVCGCDRGEDRFAA